MGKTEVNDENDFCVLIPVALINYVNKTHSCFTAWSFIVLREYIISNNLFFRKGIVHEDMEWLPRLLLTKENQKIHIFTKPFYLYRINPNSITSSFTQLRFDSQQLIFSELTERIKNASGNERDFLKKWFNRYLFYLYMYFEKDCMENSDFYKRNFSLLKQLFTKNVRILNFRNTILFVFVLINPKFFYTLRKFAKNLFSIKKLLSQN